MDIKYNLGFNKQTETLLRGVGGQDLIKECKRKDISTNVLHKLTKDDYMLLGADEQLAENMFQSLCISKGENPKPKPHQRISDKMEILKIGKNEFNFIKDVILFCIKKLEKNRINSFIEPDKALSASKVLCLAADSVLKEVDEAEIKLKELEAVIITPKKSKKYSYVQKVLYCIPVGGVCIATYILFRFYR